MTDIDLTDCDAVEPLAVAVAIFLGAEQCLSPEPTSLDPSVSDLAECIERCFVRVWKGMEVTLGRAETAVAEAFLDG